MKKWLLFLISISPATLLASQGGGINLSPNLQKIVAREVTVTSTFTLSGGTFCINNNFCLVFPSSPPAGNSHWIITNIIGKFNYVSFGGDGGGGGGTGGSDNLGSHIATTVVQGMGYAIMGSSQILIGGTTGPGLLAFSSMTNNPSLILVSFSTGGDKLHTDLEVSSWTIRASTLIVAPPDRLGSLIVGTTIQWEPDHNGQSFFLRVGNYLRPIVSNNVVSGDTAKFLFTHNAAITNMILKNTSGEGLWGESSGAFFGSLDAQNASIRVNGSNNLTVDSSGNMFLLTANSGVNIGNNNTTFSGSKFQQFAGSMTIMGVGNGLQLGTTNFSVSQAGRVAVGTSPADAAYFNTPYLLIISTPGHRGSFTASVSTYGYVNLMSSMNVHVLSTCGTNPTILGGGNAFTVTPGGGGPGACTVTFAQPFKNTPVALVTERTTSLVNTFSYTVTNTAITVTQTGIGVFDVFLAGGD